MSHSPRIPLLAIVCGCFVLSLIPACATGAPSKKKKTTADWDQSVDFSAYHTFGFEVGMPFQNKEHGEIVTEMVEIGLIGKGFVKAEEGVEPDLHVFLYPQVQFAGRIDWYTTGYTPWWGGWGGYVGVASRYTDIPVGGLMVDIVENKTDKLIWRGTINVTLKDNMVSNAKKIMKMINKMLEEFPPPPAP